MAKKIEQLELSFEVSNNETVKDGEQAMADVTSNENKLPELGPGVSTEELLYGGKPQGFITISKLFDSPRAPEEPTRKPRFIRDAVAPVPKNAKTAAGQFVLPAFATYANGVDFIYNDQRAREIRLNCYVVGVNGIGKGSVKPLLDTILSPISAEDNSGWKVHNDYNQEKEAAGDSRTKKRPVTKIRILPPDITKPELNQLGKDAEGEPLFMHVQEQDELDTLRGGQGRRGHFEILKKADDDNNSAGQLRAGTKSVSTKYTLRLNYVIELRPTELLDFFKGEVINGARDRANICEILPIEDKRQWPKMGDLGEKYFKRIRPYIENIVKAKGTIICKRANKLIDSLKAEFMEYYDETEDDVIEIITHRALCRAFKRACLCYIAEGQKWDSALDTWIRWSFMYDMWMQFHYFYDAIVGHNGKLQVTKKGPDPILLGLMPGDCITFGQIK